MASYNYLVMAHGGSTHTRGVVGFVVISCPTQRKRHTSARGCIPLRHTKFCSHPPCREDTPPPHPPHALIAPSRSSLPTSSKTSQSQQDSNPRSHEQMRRPPAFPRVRSYQKIATPPPQPEPEPTRIEPLTSSRPCMVVIAVYGYLGKRYRLIIYLVFDLGYGGVLWAGGCDEK